MRRKRPVVGEEKRELFISLFGDYILLILCVYAISKKYLKTKRKPLFDLRFFYLSQEGEKGKREKSRKKKQRKSNTLNRANSNSPGESIAREGERRSIVFCKQGGIAPILQKTIPEIEKRMKEYNTQKIIKI